MTHTKIGINVAILGVSLLGVSDGQMIEGDTSSALRIVKQAHFANETRYPSGRMHFRIWKTLVDRENKQETFYEAIEGISIWSNDKIRTELKRWGPQKQKVDMELPTDDTATCILDGKAIVYYNHRANIFMQPIAGQSILTEYRVTPKNYWFNDQLHPDYPAYKAFDPKEMSASSIAVANMKVSNEENGDIKFTRVDADTKSSLVARYSLRDGGNLVDFKLHSVSTNLKTDARLKWEKTVNGDLYLFRLERNTESVSSLGRKTSSETCEIDEFQPDYKIPENIFKITSLNAKDGTLVDDQVNKKLYRIGDKSSSAIGDSFQYLIQLMKSRGFAGPGRD